MSNDQYYMKLAIEEAKKGRGQVNPNPLVGAVVVKNDKIIGIGYHERYGELHAERNALKNCTESPEGATIYVTLEPCCHYGKTPPCTEAILEQGLWRVVIGTLDPNPIMSGKSVELLRSHGIEVEVGVMEEECHRLIRVFEKYITTKLPFVIMKYAMTMDGKIATKAGHSKWISCEQSRQIVQQMRYTCTGIMVGVQTIIDDDPLLTCRIPEGRNPVRIICDSHLRTPLTSQIVRTAKEIPTYFATICKDVTVRKTFTESGCHFIDLPAKNNRPDLKILMQILGEMKIDSILLEGGGTLNWSALEAQIVDEVDLFLAPKIFGGSGKTPVIGTGVDFPEDCISLIPLHTEQVGTDLLIENEVRYKCLQD